MSGEAMTMKDITITERLRVRISLRTGTGETIIWQEVWAEPGDTVTFAYPAEGIVMKLSAGSDAES